PGTLDQPPASGAARGDLTLHVKANALADEMFALGAALAVQLPTATDGQFAGSAQPSARALALFAYTPAPRLTFTLNAGGVLRAQARFTSVQERSGVTGGAGVTLRMWQPVSATLEVFGDVIPKGSEATPDSTMVETWTTLWTIEALAGARY